MHSAQTSPYVSLWLTRPTYTATAWLLKNAPGVDHAQTVCMKACVSYSVAAVCFCMLLITAVILNDFCVELDLNLQGLVPVAQLPCRQAAFLTAFYGLLYHLTRQCRSRACEAPFVYCTLQLDGSTICWQHPVDHTCIPQAPTCCYAQSHAFNKLRPVLLGLRLSCLSLVLHVLYFTYMLSQRLTSAAGEVRVSCTPSQKVLGRGAADGHCKLSVM